MSHHATGADVLVEGLIGAGVDVVFGVPGDTGIAFYEALYQRRGRIRHVLARDERSAAAMADAYARVTNRLGVVEASSGGGATYLVGGLGEPFAASVPLLVITSDIHRQSRGTGAITEIDQGALFSAVTKYRRTVDSAAALPRILPEAIAAALSGRPGPVSLVLPEDVLAEEAPGAASPPRAELPPARPQAPPTLVTEAAEAFRHARRPAILAGSGVHLSAAWDELRSLAEENGIAVATTIHGKGAFPEDHPLSLGTLGANGASIEDMRPLAEADAVLLVGTRANATDTDGFTAPPRGSAFVAQIDIDPLRAGLNYPGAVALPGDARAVLRQLRTALASFGRRQMPLGPARPSPALATSSPGAGHLHPAGIVTRLQAAARPDTVVTADAGTPTPWLSAVWQCRTAGRSLLIPRGHGAMGFAIPAAIGAAIAQPGRPVLCLTTDGSFALSCGELETVQRLALPITIVHLSNRSFGWIKMLQHLYQDRHYLGVDFAPVQADLVARGFGLASMHVETLDELSFALQGAQAEGKPLFIDVAVPAEHELVPPVAPWQRTLLGTGGRPVY